MAEVTETDIQVTEGIPLGVTGAHPEEELQGIEAEEAGLHLCHGALTIVTVVVIAVAQFAVAPQLNHLDLVQLRLGAGIHQYQGLLWNQSLPGGLAWTGQDHHPEVQLERRAWSLMQMVLQTRSEREFVLKA
ncbi:hypothetical protein O6P43_015667 [Quillaja saponaria]|uniref:Uncharacterized protein n=1 Tax=Quillaja saponaria TaxID=32244 RepID=A0AAD7LZ79_QUISA|nr:hypothetical protein O6P43_015667 [Quillaja saponaria]